MSKPPYTPLAASLPASVPFVGPEAQERQRGQTFRARLGANESAFGPSPKAIEAMADAATAVWQYGDPENHDLKAALSRHQGVAVERIAVGEGIDGLLQVIARLFTDLKTPVVTSAGAYPTFVYHVNGFGGRLVTVPYKDDKEDPEALAKAARDNGAALVYFANPDNPMGTWHSAEAVEALLAGLGENTVLCLDEAYVEFAPEGTAPPLALEDPRLIRLRTFSKAYGMAGARVGYAVTSPELAKAFDKVRNHFGVNRIAQAGALAALADEAYLHRVKAHVSAAKARIAEIAKAHGLSPIDSATNFLTLDVGADGDAARRLVVALADRGVFVRMPFVAPQDRCIRVTAAPDAMLDVFEAEIGPALNATFPSADAGLAVRAG